MFLTECACVMPAGKCPIRGMWMVMICGLLILQAGCGSSDSEVDPDDREAVARAFLAQLVEGTITPGTIGFHEIPDQFVQEGRALYIRYGCTICHGMEGGGNGPVSYTLKPPPRDFRDPGAYRIGRDVVTIAGTLRDGMPDSRSMVPFPHIKDEERFKIAMYVASLQPDFEGSPTEVPPTDVTPAEGSPAVGSPAEGSPAEGSPAVGSRADDLEVTGAWVRATPPNRDVTAAYLVIENRSDRSRELLAVETPAAAYTELHTMRYVDDMMEMEKIESLVVPPRGAAGLEPGGDHIMLFGVAAPLAEGDSVSLTLRFADRSTRTVTAEVLKDRRSTE